MHPGSERLAFIPDRARQRLLPHDLPDGESHHSVLPSEPELRVKAIESLLIRKGLVDPAALDRIVDAYEHRIGPRNGARVVAKAWTDPEFKSELLRAASPLLDEMGLSGRQGEHVVAVENTESAHNLVVCTLCSCYPWPLLGIPPSWYKSDAYRSRAVREPRRVLAEFGVDLLSTQNVRVWDSTAEIRYLVLPMRPRESLGADEEVLVEWVTRDSMIGAGLPKCPQPAR